MTKAEARKEFLNKRQVLMPAESKEFNRQITERVLASDHVNTASTIHIFLPLKQKFEPDTWMIINKIYPRKRLVVPRVNASGALDHFYYEGFEQMIEGRFGILEPARGVRAEVNEIDLVFVPLVAFDKEGNRVGYGKGYYDRFLSGCRADCIKAGLSFFAPADKFSDVEGHDVPLDLCFTPNKVYTF